MSSTWHSKDLGDGVDALVPTTQIQEAFEAAYVAAGQPAGMAVFSRYDLRVNVVTVYFTPEASVLAHAFGASPCAKPSSEGIGLSVGEHRAWERYFPERLADRS